MADRDRTVTRWLNRLTPLVAMLTISAGLVTLIGASPAAAATTPVRGPGAYGVFGSVSLFGGPYNPFGSKPPAPAVELPPGGTTTVPNLSLIYGPATFFRSGTATVSTQATAGSVTSSSSFAATAGQGNTPCPNAPRSVTDGATHSNNVVTSATANFVPNIDVGSPISGGSIPAGATIVSVQSLTSVTISAAAGSTATKVAIQIGSAANGPNGSCIYNSQFTADTASSTCTTNSAGSSASTHFTKGLLVTETDANQSPTKAVVIPDNPPPNLTISGFFLLGPQDRESFTYIFNEQIHNPDGSITVNAAHLIAQGVTAYGDAVFGHAACGQNAPTCTVTAVRRLGPTGHAEQDVTVQDTGSGLASITNVVVTNGTEHVASGPPGGAGTLPAPIFDHGLPPDHATSGQITVVLTLVAANASPTSLEFDVTDMAGTTRHCGTTTTDTPCTTRVTGAFSGTLLVRSGLACVTNAQVNGSIIVAAGAALDAENSTIAGSISATGPSSFVLCGDKIGGTVSVRNATGFVLIGDPGDDSCAANSIAGSLVLMNNTRGLEAIGNHVGGAITLSGNSGSGPFPEDTAPDVSGNSR